jgi:hypothetical protein
LPAFLSESHCFQAGVQYGHFSIWTHQAGGSGVRNDCSRDAGPMQRGATVLAWETNSCVPTKTFQIRAES